MAAQPSSSPSTTHNPNVTSASAPASTQQQQQTSSPRAPPIPEHEPLDLSQTSTQQTTTTERGRSGKSSLAGGGSSSSTVGRRESRSPSATRFKERMTGIVEKIKGAVSREPSADGRGRAEEGERGRGDFKIATGRGGAGNMFRSKSPPGSREAVQRHGGGVITVEEERAQSNERARSKERPHASGRGGAGNIRSPSRDPAKRQADEEKLKQLNAEEHDVEAKHEQQGKEHPEKFAIGRGGAGNIH